jgi:AraC-like DNA-binding protein
VGAVLLETDDLGEAEEVFSAQYTKVHCSAPADASTRTRVLRSQIGPVVVDEIDFGFDLNLQAEPLPDIVLCRVRSGVITHRLPNGQFDQCHPGEVFAAGACAGIPFSADVLTAHYDAVTISRRVLSEIAIGAPHLGEPKPIRLTGASPISIAANDYLVKAIDYVSQGVINDPHAARSPLIVSAVENYLAAAVLATYPNTALIDPTIEDRHDTTPVLLTRAIAYIEDHAHLGISSADIARAVYVTPRALQLMFRKHRDCTPTEYLRRVRLHHAHLDLVSADRLSTTVGTVARRWGFGHVGRFAVYYRQHYGRSPHDTLRT